MISAVFIVSSLYYEKVLVLVVLCMLVYEQKWIVRLVVLFGS